MTRAHKRTHAHVGGHQAATERQREWRRRGGGGGGGGGDKEKKGRLGHRQKGEKKRKQSRGGNQAIGLIDGFTDPQRRRNKRDWNTDGFVSATRGQPTGLPTPPLRPLPLPHALCHHQQQGGGRGKGEKGAPGLHAAPSVLDAASTGVVPSPSSYHHDAQHSCLPFQPSHLPFCHHLTLTFPSPHHLIPATQPHTPTTLHHTLSHTPQPHMNLIHVAAVP